MQVQDLGRTRDPSAIALINTRSPCTSHFDHNYSMDLTSMLNRKGEAAAGAGPDQQLRQQLQAAANGQTMSEAGSRAGSPHGSEHSYANGRMTMRYPSPTAMGQSPLPMLPGYHAPYNGQMQQQDPNRAPARQTAGDGTAVKAFPCKDCGKGFARRSDLARHGQLIDTETLSNPC